MPAFPAVSARVKGPEQLGDDLVKPTIKSDYHTLEVLRPAVHVQQTKPDGSHPSPSQWVVPVRFHCLKLLTGLFPTSQTGEPRPRFKPHTPHLSVILDAGMRTATVAMEFCDLRGLRGCAPEPAPEPLWGGYWAEPL